MKIFKLLLISNLLISSTAFGQYACKDSSGNLDYPLCDANNYLDVAVMSVIPGTSATSLGKAEDSAHSTGDAGVASLAIRSDTLGTAGNIAGAAGDYTGLQTDALGALWVDLVSFTNTVCVAITPDDDAAYQANDVVATEDATDPLLFSSVFRQTIRSGILSAIHITNTEIDGVGWKFVLFNADPSTSTTTDGEALDVADADLTKIVAQVSISDCTSYADNELCQATGINLPIDGTAVNVWGALITPGAPQWAASQKVNVCMTFIQD